MKTLEQQLFEYGAFHEREQGTLSLDDATTTQTAFIGDQTVNRRPWRVTAAAAAAVLILIGGVGLLMRIGTDSETPPRGQSETPTTQEQIEPDQSPESPRLTNNIPPELESGTLTTPVGDARWVQLTGDGSSLPSGDALSWPNGFAIFDGTRLWVSPDGVKWQIEPIPASDGADDVTLTLVDGEYWLISTNPNQIWRSTDGVTWDEYDSSGLRPPGPAGLFWRMGFDAPVSGSGLTLSYAAYEANLPYQEYLTQLIDGFNLSSERDQGCSGLRKLEPGVFAVVSRQADHPCPHWVELRFEETRSGLRVLDNATGAILGEVLGADLSHVERLAQAGDAYNEQRILILGDSEITQVETPWSSSNPQKLFGTDEWVYAYVTDWRGDVTVWRTDDGRSWTDLGAPSFLQNAPVSRAVQFWPLESSLAVTVIDLDDESNSNVGWESLDGITWEPGPVGQPDETTIVRLESGWFANNGSKGSPFIGDAWWVHIDGTWVSLADLGMEAKPGCVVNATGIENTTFFDGGPCHNRESGARDFWVFSLEPSD